MKRPPWDPRQGDHQVIDGERFPLCERIDDLHLPIVEPVLTRDDVPANHPLALRLHLHHLRGQTPDEEFEPPRQIHVPLAHALERRIEGRPIPVVELAQREEPLEVVARAIEAERREEPRRPPVSVDEGMDMDELQNCGEFDERITVPSSNSDHVAVPSRSTADKLTIVSERILAKSLSGSSSSSGRVSVPPADVYFSVDVETDGPIPGPYSMLSFALVPAGRMDGRRYAPPTAYDDVFYVELRPISEQFEKAALAVNGLDRERLMREGLDPSDAMRSAVDWLRARCAGGEPVLVAYPLGFDWSWLHWYFVQFVGTSPFKHSRAFDLKTAVAVTEGIPISGAGRSRLPESLVANRAHTHHAADDAIAQAEIFSKLMIGISKRRAP